MRYDSLFEKFYFESSLESLLEQTLREMGGITIDVGYNILSPLYNKNTSVDSQEIISAIKKIRHYTIGGTVVYYDENRNVIDDQTWIGLVLDKISRARNRQIIQTDNLVKQIFLSR